MYIGSNSNNDVIITLHVEHPMQGPLCGTVTSSKCVLECAMPQLGGMIPTRSTLEPAIASLCNTPCAEQGRCPVTTWKSRHAAAPAGYSTSFRYPHAKNSNAETNRSVLFTTLASSLAIHSASICKLDPLSTSPLAVYSVYPAPPAHAR